jgi:hypothetical protein
VRKVKHHVALPYVQIGAFMAALRTREAVAARALEFTILTAARTGEILGARWDEICDACQTASGEGGSGDSIEIREGVKLAVHELAQCKCLNRSWLRRASLPSVCRREILHEEDAD